jgi:putative toxin-antitoxin system antitoxin component (TIGR02293 family)
MALHKLPIGVSLPQHYIFLRSQMTTTEKIAAHGPRLGRTRTNVHWFESSRGDLKLHQEVVEGIEVVRLLSFMRKHKEFKLDELAKALRVSPRTMSRLIDGQNVTLDVPQGEALVGLLQTVQKAELVFGSTDAALAWLRSPEISFGSQNPIELLSTSFGTKSVQTLLERIEHGVYN